MTEWTKITLRLPVQVHTALSADAKERDTSLNQVIVDRLNRSLGGVYVTEEEANDGTILQRLSRLEVAMKRLDPEFPLDDESGGAFEVMSARLTAMAKGEK